MDLDLQSFKRLQEIFKKLPEVVAVYFYGSRVKDYAHKSSDLDMAVVVDNIQGMNYSKLYLQISKIVEFFELDLRIATLKNDPTYLFEVIGGRCVYKRSEEARISFETKVLENFYDGKHIRDIYYRYLRQYFGVRETC